MPEIDEHWLDEQKLPGKTFCPMFFVHRHVNTSGEIQPCCISQKRPGGWSTNELIEAGAQSLNSVRIASCDVCYATEQKSQISYRQEMLEASKQFKEALSTAIVEKVNAEIFYDLRVSNLCNLACIMCDPISSSTISKAYKIVFPIRKWTVRKVNPMAKRVHLAGGEPFLIKEYRSLLDQIQNNDCEIIINTNGTVVDTFLLRSLSRFTNVCIMLSVDGIGKIGEAIRKNMVWEDVLSNIKILIDAIPQATFLIHTVVQRDNINELYEIAKFVEEQKFEWRLTILKRPTELHYSKAAGWEVPDKIFLLPSIRQNLRAMSVLKELRRDFERSKKV